MTRSTIRSLHAALLTGGMCVGLSGTAHAQDAEEAAPAPAEESSWTDGITVGAFVDAYAALRSDNNEPRLVPGTIPVSYSHDGYVLGDGFGLAFAGADLAYSGDQFGATISLRFGPGVQRFYATDMGALGLDNITAAYLTWKPFENLTLDMGQFGTIYGAEVAESWRNVNYTRGGLYYAMQPFWHTGLKANYAINDMFGVNAMVVNGVNTAIENNKSPSVGVQGLITPMDGLFFAVGYLGAIHPRDGGEAASNFDHFFDVVATAQFGDFKLVGNFDYNMYRPAGVGDSENWWGVSLAPAYAITNWFTVGARVEYLADSANAVFLMPDEDVPANPDGSLNPETDSTSLTTLTATLDFKPVPNSSALVLRPEFRYEIASQDYFADGDNELTGGYWALVLGAVVTSM
jgi:hypothetical protein